MANQIVSMTKLKRAFQRLAKNVPQREICKDLHIGRGVLNRYKKAADDHKIAYATLGRMSNEEISDFLKSTSPEPALPEKKRELNELIPDYVASLERNRYLTIQRLHERYKKEYPDGYEYTQFKKQIRDYQTAHKSSYTNIYYPGEEMQVDFAGDNLYITDKLTGRRTNVVVIVCVLPFSRLGFIKAMLNASMELMYAALSDALTAFGGTPYIAKSDNMRQWVKKVDRYEPTFNDAAIEWGSYYDITLDACRVSHPKDKSPAEGLVDKVYKAVYAEVFDEVFYDIDSLNTRITELMDEFNSKPSRVTKRSRIEVFLEEEKETLKPLPPHPFRFRYRKEVKVPSGYHITVKNHQYSVPYQYIGQKVSVTWDTDNVEVYSDHTRIASHKRTDFGPPSTLDEHMPPKHLEYKLGRGYNAAYYLDQAEKIGENTHHAVDAILKRNKHVEQGYKACAGVMSLRRKYGSERLERACKRLADCNSITYTMIKHILEKNLDTVTNEQPATYTPINQDVRGAAEFARILSGN